MTIHYFHFSHKQMEEHTILYPLSHITFFFLFVSSITCPTESVNAVKVHHHHGHQHHHHHQEEIIQEAADSPKLFAFGDSYADTGNWPKSTAISWKKPYGMTFPGEPTGRFSDGRVLTDYIASFLGINSPVPFNKWLQIGEISALQYGLNFAHGGTGVFTTFVNEPNMTTQINVFQQLIQEEEAYDAQNMSSSIALVSVAGNDYAAYLAKNGTNEDLPAFTKSLMSQLVLNLQRIHGLGVRKVGITAMPPLGCLPQITASISHKNCSETGNSLAKFHNQMLQESVEKLNNVTGSDDFVILDLYSSFMSALDIQKTHPGNSTFESQLRPCCVGMDGGYSCGSVNNLGLKKYKVCDDPKRSFFWDTIHPSQQGWQAVYSALKPFLQNLLN